MWQPKNFRKGHVSAGSVPNILVYCSRIQLKYCQLWTTIQKTSEKAMSVLEVYLIVWKYFSSWVSIFVVLLKITSSWIRKFLILCLYQNKICRFYIFNITSYTWYQNSTFCTLDRWAVELCNREWNMDINVLIF